MTTDERAKAIVGAILRDMTGRRGLRQEWDGISPEIQEEIREKWRRIVVSGLVPERFPGTEPPDTDRDVLVRRDYWDVEYYNAKHRTWTGPDGDATSEAPCFWQELPPLEGEGGK